MTAPEKFEKWWESEGYMLGHNKEHDRAIWQAALSANKEEIDALKAEVFHWKSNHDNMVNRSRVLIDRTDLPLERVIAFNQIETYRSEIESLKAENEQLRKDAERYRWLSLKVVGQHDHITSLQQICFPLIRPISNVLKGSVAQHLDEAIDAAMTASPDTEVRDA